MIEAELGGAEEVDGSVFSEADLIDADGPEFCLPGGVDEEWLLGELWKDLYRGEQAKSVLAEAQMRRVIEVQSQIEHRTMEGLGQLEMRVPLDVYLYWINREGIEFWKDAGNRDFFAKRNPGMKLRATVPTTVVVDKPISAPQPVAAPVVDVRRVMGNRGAAGAVAPLSPRRGRGRWAS